MEPLGADVLVMTLLGALVYWTALLAAGSMSTAAVDTGVVDDGASASRVQNLPAFLLVVVVDTVTSKSGWVINHY